MQIIVILMLNLFILTHSHFLRTHQYWYTAEKPLIKTGASFADISWNYCDFKCIYL
jgi:hypothetical protein